MGAAETDDLEALFDQIAAQSAATPAAAAPVAPAPVAVSAPAAEDDLEALFDQIAADSNATRVTEAVAEPVIADAAASVAVSVAASASPAHAPGEPPAPEEVFHRIGALTRNLHDALRELGYDKAMESAVSSLPDARDRLNYIFELTGKAAERALAAVEHGQSYQSELETKAVALSKQWDRVFNAEMPVEEFKTVAAQTRAFLSELPAHTSKTNEQFTEIMMAQDFHDLTGQVIQRIVKVAQNLEQQLLQLLLETTPQEKRASVAEGEWLTGPAMNAAGRTDVVQNQEQVDDLLESLGF